MIKFQVSAALLVSLIFGNAAIAAEPPTPRQPIGPRVNEMLPPLSSPGLQRTPPLTEDRIRILNNGDQQLFISYWDGETAWRPIAIDSGRSTDIVCQKCRGAIPIAYHNGKEDMRISAKLGATYALGWSDQTGVWVFTSSPLR
jgi:hypothetical protein